MAEYGPLHTDRNKSPINWMLVLGLAAIAADIFLSGGVTGLSIVGAGVAIYAWFTTPTSYMLYNDRLVIAYGRPRLRHVMFDNIEAVDNLLVPLSGPRLRVREFRGRGAWLTPRDPETFLEQFRIAMEQFRGTSSDDPGFVPFQRDEGTDWEGGSADPALEDSRESPATDLGEQESGTPEVGSSEQEDPWGRRE